MPKSEHTHNHRTSLDNPGIMKSYAFHGHTKPVSATQFSTEGDLLFSASKDGACAVWSVENGARLGTYDGHSAIQGLHVNHSTSILCTSGSDFKTVLWKVDDGKPLVQWDNPAPVRSPEFSHDDRFLLQITDKKMGIKTGTINVYDIPASLGQPGSEVKTIRTRFTYTTSEGILGAHWGPTNDTIYFCSDDGSVSIMDVETQKEVACASPHNEEVRKIRFDARYFLLTTASKDKTAKLLDCRTLKTVSTYDYGMPVNDAHLSPKADHVLVGGGVEAVDVTTTAGESKFSIKFYHSVHETMLGQFYCHFGTINTCEWHPNGNIFATGAHDGFVKLHMMPDSYRKSPGSKPIFTVAVKEDDDYVQEDEEAQAEDEGAAEAAAGEDDE